GQGRIQSSHDSSSRVRNSEDNRGRFLFFFGTQLRERRVGKRRVFSLGFLLGFLTLLLSSLGSFLQIVSKGRAVRWFLSSVERFSLKGFSPSAERLRLDVHHRVFDWEQGSFLRQRFALKRAERRVVVQHVETAAERSNNQIVLAFLNRQIAHRNCRQPALKLNPFLAAVDGEEQSEFSADKQQVWVRVIFGNRQHRPVSWKIALKRGPGFSAIRALKKVGREVAALVILKRRVHCVSVVLRGDHATHV